MPPDVYQESETMTAKEAARALGVSRTTLQRKFIATKRLAPVNPPNQHLDRARRLLFRRADVLALAAPHLDAAPPRLLAEDGPGYDPAG
jgi:AraC-like DNA-binding protein